MIRICHLLTSDTSDDAMATIGRLLRGLDRREFDQRVACLDGAMTLRAKDALHAPILRIHLRLSNVVPSWKPHPILADETDVIHLWTDRPVPGIGRTDRGPALIMSIQSVQAARRSREAWCDETLEGLSLVCDTESAVRSLMDGGYDGARCVVIPPAAETRGEGLADVARSERRTRLRERLRLSADQPVLLAPPPPSHEGGHYFAVWASALLQQMHPDIRLILPGESTELNRLRRFAASFRLPAVLITPGWRYGLRELADAADVFVSPALGNVSTGPVVQAMAAGIPVAASDVPALRERIEAGVTGLLVPPQKPTRLAEAVLKLLEDRGLCERLSQEAIARAGAAFSTAAQVDRHAEVYRQATSRPKTSRFSGGQVRRYFQKAIRAMGAADPPEQILVQGQVHTRLLVFKHDFFAATALYEGPLGKVVLKLGRRESFLGLPLAWIGRVLIGHEARLYEHLDGIPGVPRFLGHWQNYGLMHEYVEGHQLARGEWVGDEFFPQLSALIGQVHQRHTAYVDLEKRENILVGDDGRPYLIDFQISWHVPSSWRGHRFPARFVLKVLQDADRYHLRKHHRRTRPDQLTDEQIEAGRRPPFYIAWHRVLTRPFTRIRRRALRRIEDE